LRKIIARSNREPTERYEGLLRGYICWIDEPIDWRRVTRRFRLSGWCFSRDGEKVEGLRARLGDREFIVSHGLARPDVAIYSLNSVRRKTFRDIRIVKGLHQMKCPIEHVNSAVRATVGGHTGKCLLGWSRWPSPNRPHPRSIDQHEIGMTEARCTVNHGTPGADRTV
jgi:hypothetical protein